MRTHMTWSIEGPDNTCPACGHQTLLVIPFLRWKVDEERAREVLGDGCEDYADGDVEVDDEVSGHFCPECCRLVSLSLNTLDLRATSPGASNQKG